MAAPKWKTDIEDYVLGQQNDGINTLTSEITENKITLLEFIEGLGKHLTSPETHTRCRAVRLLGEIIHRLSTDFLSTKEVSVLVVFFCERLKDHHSITPHVLYGLTALTSVPVLSSEDVQTILRSIFREVHVQVLAQGDRRHAYNIFDYFLTNRLDDVKKLGVDMVYGFVQAMDSEKDPRNLVIAFKCAACIAQNFPIDMLAEEFFEVVSCYFPIDFTPPPTDPFGIRKEDLIVELRNVFASTEKFAEFSLPLLLEKLQSTIISAKIDSLHTLKACAKVYGAEALYEYTNSFWSCIRREVFTAVSPAMDDASLSALTALTAALSTEVTESGKTPVLHGFLQDIYKDLKKHINEPEMRLMAPCCNLLKAAAAGSESACYWLLAKLLPLLQELYAKHLQVVPRKNILLNLNGFLQLARTILKSGQEESVLREYYTTLYSLYVSTISQSSRDLKVLAGQGLADMVLLPKYFNPEETVMAINHINSLILEDSNASVGMPMLKSLAEICVVGNHDQIILQNTVPKLVAQLETESMEVDGVDIQDSRTSLVLHGLEILSCTKSLVETNTGHLIDYITSHSANEQTTANLNNCTFACTCLKRVLAKHVNNPHCLVFFKDVIYPKCWRLLLRLSCDLVDGARPVLLHDTVIALLAGCCRLIVSQIEDFEAGIVEFCDEFLQETVLTANNNLHLHLLPIFTSVVCSTKNPVDNTIATRAINGLMSLDLQSLDAGILRNLLLCVSALLNKMPEGDELTHLISAMDSKVSSLTKNDSQKKIGTHLLIFLTKAFVIRGHSSQSKYISQLLDCFTVEAVAEVAAEGFGIILNNSEEALNRETHANFKITYKQRFFLQTQSHLINGFNDVKAEMKRFYLIALSHHLKNVPKQAIHPELPKLLPLLVKSLNIEQTDLQESTMQTLVDILKETPAMLVPYVDDVLPTLISLSRFKPQMRIRIAALTCLGASTQLPHPNIYPYQKTVLQSLGTAVDDHKRLVRREAVKTRTDWYLVGSSKTD